MPFSCKRVSDRYKQITNLPNGDPHIEAYWEKLKELIAEDMFVDTDFNGIGTNIRLQRMRATKLWTLFLEDNVNNLHKAKHLYLIYTIQEKQRLYDEQNLLAYVLVQLRVSILIKKTGKRQHQLLRSGRMMVMQLTKAKYIKILL